MAALVAAIAAGRTLPGFTQLDELVSVPDMPVEESPLRIRNGEIHVSVVRHREIAVDSAGDERDVEFLTVLVENR
jgi:hypothetical protein